MNRREMFRLSAAGALTAGFDPPATAQDAKPNPDEMIHRYLAAEVNRLSGNFLDGAKTKPEWEARRPRLKAEFLDMLGLRPLPEKTDLKATVTGEFERGGPSRWTRKNPPNTVGRSLALLGQTVDTGRVRDVVGFLTPPGGVHFRRGAKAVRLFGRGEAGVIAAYAALLAWGQAPGTAASQVIILDPPASHAEGPHFLGVMRVLDVPEALGLLAPAVKLTLIGAKDKAFDRTAAIYKLAGAEAKFERK